MCRVKICGITRREDALAAVEYGADALGFVFFKQSPRYITPERARDIIKQLPPFITTVGVFVNEEASKIDEIINATGLAVVQLHGNEPQDMCYKWQRVIKAFRISDIIDLDLVKNYHVSAYLLDTYSEKSYGGTGETFNWDIAAAMKEIGKIILAGGLTPQNVEKAVRHVHPYAVDVSSSVEQEKGIKDADKMKLFIERAKSVFL